MAVAPRVVVIGAGIVGCALADELSSVLTYSRSLEVRPSSVTRKYVALDLEGYRQGSLNESLAK